MRKTRSVFSWMGELTSSELHSVHRHSCSLRYSRVPQNTSRFGIKRVVVVNVWWAQSKWWRHALFDFRPRTPYLTPSGKSGVGPPQLYKRRYTWKLRTKTSGIEHSVWSHYFCINSWRWTTIKVGRKYVTWDSKISAHLRFCFPGQIKDALWYGTSNFQLRLCIM